MNEPLWIKDMNAQEGKLAEGGMVKVEDGKPDGFIAGWATTSDMDSYRHVVAPGAFAESIKEAGISGPKGIKLLLDHDYDRPAGRITKLEYRNRGLWIEAHMDLDVSYARDRYFAAKSNGGLAFSVGFRPDRDSLEVLEDADEREYLLIKKGTLREVSIVANPANKESGMEFIKNEGQDELVKANTPRWRVGTSRTLLVGADVRWDGAVAKSRIFEAAGFDDGDPDPAMARQAFLVYDAANPTLKGSYKLPFADIRDGRIRAMPAGLRAAASRLPQTDIPESVMARARSIIDGYEDRMSKAAEDLTLDQLGDLLVAEGWVKDEETVEGLVTIIKANLHLFTEPPEQDTKIASASTAESALAAARRLKALLNQEANNG